MTLVEVVFAGLILFVALTALLGLVAASTRMTARAKTQTVAVNAANAFIELVRQQDYGTLTQTKINTLAAESAGSVGGISVETSATISRHWVTGANPAIVEPSYFKLVVTSTASGNGDPYSFTTSTFIRRWRVGFGPSRLKPIVAFSGTSPTEGQVVYSTVQVGATGESRMDDTPLIRLGVYAGGSPIVENNDSAQTLSVSGTWDTTAWRDGKYALTAEVRDATQLQIASRLVYVDNFPPTSAPSTVTLNSVVANTSTTWSWGSVLDGASLVDDYALRWRKMDLYGEFNIVASPIVNPPIKDGRISASLATDSFGFYRLALRGRRPRETYAGYTGDQVGPWSTRAYYVSRPNFSGTITINSPGTDYQNKNAPGTAAEFTPSGFTYDTPTFMRTGESVKWQYRYGTDTTWRDFANGTRITAPVVGVISTVSVRCVVRLTPKDSTQINVPSCIVGYTGSSGAMVRSAVVDWSRWPDTLTDYNPTWSNWAL